MEGETDIIERVVSGVAAREGVAATDLPPLVEYVDPDALASLTGHANGDPGAGVTVRFRYLDYTVTVSDSGIVSIDG